MEQKIKTISCDDIEKPILDYVVVSNADVTRMAESNGPIPTVMLARVNGELYPIGGFAALEAARRREDDSLKCTVSDYDTKEDAVRAGLLQCSVAEPINVLKSREIVEFFGGDVSESVRKINMGKTHFEKIAKARLIPEIYEKLDAVLDRLSSKLPAHMLAIPPYILMALSNVNARKQLAVFDTIYMNIEFDVPASQFTWPNSIQIGMCVRETNVVEDEDGVILHAERPAQTNNAKVKEDEDAVKLAKCNKNCIIIPEPDGSYLVVNTKTKTGHKLTRTGDMRNFKAESVSVWDAFLIPPDGAEHLGLDSNELHEEKSNSPDDAIEDLNTLPKTAKIVILWTND